jgi:hypothetical protein
MKRRHQLGELTPSDVEEGFPSARLLTEKGAGELFQAVVGGTALSSVLVLKAAEGASGDSGGTSPEGLKCGASPFLLYSICRALREESIWTFNFGPAEPNTSMSLFKKHFGTTTVPLEFAKFYLGSEFRRKLTDAVRLIRQTKSAISPRTGPDSR